MPYTFTLSGFDAWLAQFDDKARRGFIRGLRKGAMMLERNAVNEISVAEPHPAVDTGQLRQSVNTDFVPDGAIVKVDAPHAGFMEYGTRPHKPPRGPLMEWAKRKGFAKDDKEAKRVAIAVQKAIAKRGIAPRSYFAKAWAQTLEELPGIVVREVAKALEVTLSYERGPGPASRVKTGVKGGRFVFTKSGRRRYIGRRHQEY